jgi:hypothetical protein
MCQGSRRPSPLVECDAVWFGRPVPTLRTYLLPRSYALKSSVVLWVMLQVEPLLSYKSAKISIITVFHVSFIVAPNTIALSHRKPESSGKFRDICRHDKSSAAYNAFFKCFWGFLLTGVLFGSYISFYERVGKYFLVNVFVCCLKFVKLNDIAHAVFWATLDTE